MKTKPVLICGVLIVLAACASVEQRPATTEAKPSGLELIQKTMPPEYFDGYAAGYLSGVSGQLRKDLDRYLSDPKYRTGWDDGYRVGENEPARVRAIYR